MEPLPILRPVRIPRLPRLIIFDPWKHPIKVLRKNPVDVAVDWIYLPSTAEFRLPFSVNNQQGGTRYVQTELSSPPAGWSDSPRNHGSLDNGYTLTKNHLASRTTPSFTDGEYDETLTLAIRLFKDSAYSELDVELTVQYVIHHFKSDDPAWSLLHFADFESGDDGWSSGKYTDNWSKHSSPERGAPGYGSSNGIYNSSDYNQKNDLKVYDAAFDSTSESVGNTRKTLFVESSIGDIPSDTWIAIFGYMSDLSKSYVGLVLRVTYWYGDICLFHTNGFSKPSASKVYWSLVARHCTDEKWHFDRVRIVYK